MTEYQQTGAAGARDPKGEKPKHMDEAPKELARFYSALGYFNATIVAQAIDDPDSIKDLIKILTAECPVHDASCDQGYAYDHVRNVCVKMPDTNF
jgi:hypothetical protein